MALNSLQSLPDSDKTHLKTTGDYQTWLCPVLLANHERNTRGSRIVWTGCSSPAVHSYRCSSGSASSAALLMR